MAVPASSAPSDTIKLTTKAVSASRWPTAHVRKASPDTAPSTTVICPPHVKLKAMILALAGVVNHAGIGGTRNVANAMPENALSAKCA